jgi:DNA-binding MarR family transcriptional regulator
MDRSELALRLSDAISAAAAAGRRAGDRAFSAFGLSKRGHEALAAVDEAGDEGARPSALAERLGISRAAATTFVRRLEARELVETTPDPDDDRSVRVSLTRRGVEVLVRVGQLERRLAARVVSGLPASSVQRTIHLLDELRHRLEEREIKLVT